MKRPSKANKLTLEIVRKLRAANREAPINAIDAAMFYSVSAETIRRILRHETWTNAGEGTSKTEALEIAERALKVQEEYNAGQAKLAKETAALKEKNERPDKMLAELDGSDGGDRP